MVGRKYKAMSSWISMKSRDVPREAGVPLLAWRASGDTPKIIRWNAFTLTWYTDDSVYHDMDFDYVSIIYPPRKKRYTSKSVRKRIKIQMGAHS
jgi:hypothetical protein